MEDEFSLRQHLGDSRRWVIKIGSALSTNEGVGLNHSAIEKWSKQIVSLMSAGHQVVLVTSGSVAEGATPARMEGAAPFVTSATGCCCNRANGTG